MTKAEIRQHCLEARRAMSSQQVAAKSSVIIDQLKTLPAFARASAFLCYVSSKDNEVDTHGLIACLLKKRQAVLVPITEPGGRLEWSRLWALDELAPGRFGILEPAAAHRRIMQAPPNAVAVVPGIAFTPECDRVGYGGGYFDRFLATFGGPVIGLAFDLQIVSRAERASHDVPTDFVITESFIYRRAAP